MLLPVLHTYIVLLLIAWLMEGEKWDICTDVDGRCPQSAAAGANTAGAETSNSVCSSTSPSAAPEVTAATIASATRTPAAATATEPTATATPIPTRTVISATTTNSAKNVVDFNPAASDAVPRGEEQAVANDGGTTKEKHEREIVGAVEAEIMSSFVPPLRNDGGNTEEKHGGESVGSAGAEIIPSLVSPSLRRNDDLRKALVGFYSVHNPGKIANLDAILKQYAGKEGLLIERLEHKYSADLSYARRSPAAPALSSAAGSSHLVPDGVRQPPPPRKKQQQEQQQQQQRQQGKQAQVLSSTGAPAVGAAPAQSHSLSPPQRSSHTSPTLTDEALAAHRGGGGGGGRGDGGFALPRPLGSTSNVGPSAASKSRSESAAAQHSGVGVGGAATSNYMTYLADQIRSNVEGLLPASSSGGGGGGSGSGIAGSGSPPYPASYIPSMRTSTAGARKQLAAGMEGAAGGVRRRGDSGTMTTAGDSGGSGINASRHHQHSQGELDPVLTARVRALEEERGGLVAACRRMQAKAEASSREAAATEELREAGQRKMSGFAERAAAAERQAREAMARLRTLEGEQAALKADKEASARRCAVKHAQLLSAINLQMSLRSQLEGLLEVVPPVPSSGSSPKAHERGSLQREGSSSTSADAVAGGRSGGSSQPRLPDAELEEEVVSASVAPAGTRTEGNEAPGAGRGTSTREGRHSLRNMDGGGVRGGGDGAGGDEGGGGGLDEIKRRCFMLEVSLRASRREALEVRRSRDAAEQTVRQQREALAKLKGRVSELEASLAREQEASEGASRAARGLEAELELRLGHLRKAEADISDQRNANSRVREELRAALARLSTASAARTALIGFCRQERAAVELLAAEQVVRAEESAGMRGEEGLARGLELARMAAEAGDKRAAGLRLEVDRLAKALFASRAKLAGSEARAQGLRRELERAAEAIADLSKSAIASSAAAAAAGERGGERGLGGGEVEAGGSLEGAGAGERGGKGGGARGEGPGGLTEEEAFLMRTPVHSEPNEGAGGGAGGVGGGSATGAGRGLFVRNRSRGTAGSSGPRAVASDAAARPLTRPDVPSSIATPAAATKGAGEGSATVKKARRAIRGRSPRSGERQQGQMGFVEL